MTNVLNGITGKIGERMGWLYLQLSDCAGMWEHCKPDLKEICCRWKGRTVEDDRQLNLPDPVTNGKHKIIDVPIALTHLRNSIMHGLYQISRKGSKVYVEFESIQPPSKTTALKGIVELNRLKEMMNIIKN